MIVDEWRGLAVHRSKDLKNWTRQGLILDTPGKGPEDGAIGQHPDVVVADGKAHIFYFTHPDDASCTSLHVARLTVIDDRIECARDAAVPVNANRK